MKTDRYSYSSALEAAADAPKVLAGYVNPKYEFVTQPNGYTTLLVTTEEEEKKDETDETGD